VTRDPHAFFPHVTDCKSYQAHENGDKLDDISVSNAVQPAEKGVEDGNECADNDRRRVVDIDNDRQRCAFTGLTSKRARTNV
jgi:hypothetical protein